MAVYFDSEFQTLRYEALEACLLYTSQYDLAYGALLAAVGLIMLLHPEGFIAVLYIVMGILFLADGLFKTQMAIDAKRFGVGKWWLIIALAALTGLAGLLLILRPFDGAKAVMILLGISLLDVYKRQA